MDRTSWFLWKGEGTPRVFCKNTLLFVPTFFFKSFLFISLCVFLLPRKFFPLVLKLSVYIMCSQFLPITLVFSSIWHPRYITFSDWKGTTVRRDIMLAKRCLAKSKSLESRFPYFGHFFFPCGTIDYFRSHFYFSGGNGSDRRKLERDLSQSVKDVEGEIFFNTRLISYKKAFLVQQRWKSLLFLAVIVQ